MVRAKRGWWSGREIGAGEPAWKWRLSLCTIDAIVAKSKPNASQAISIGVRKLLVGNYTLYRVSNKYARVPPGLQAQHMRPKLPAKQVFIKTHTVCSIISCRVRSIDHQALSDLWKIHVNMWCLRPDFQSPSSQIQRQLNSSQTI